MIIYVEQEVYDRLNSRLKDMTEKMPAVMKGTINDTAKEARGRILKKAKENYVVKENRFNRAMSIEYATERHWGAVIETKGNPLPLYDFRIRKNRGITAAKAKVLTNSSLKELTLKGADNGKDLKAFVQKVKKGKSKGHYGIFQRIPSNEREELQRRIDKEKKKKVIRNNDLIERLGKRVRKRYIRQLYSLSIPQMVEGEKVYPMAEKAISEGLRENLEKHIALMMEGLK